MITLNRNKQKMKYSLYMGKAPIYERDENGNIKTYIDEDGNEIPLETGSYEDSYSEPVDFYSSINNKLDEVLIKEFGVDDSTKFAQLVTSKGYIPLKVGSVIWKKSEVGYRMNDSGIEVLDVRSADYTVLGVADEGLNFDLFLLQRNVK